MVQELGSSSCHSVEQLQSDSNALVSYSSNLGAVGRSHDEPPVLFSPRPVPRLYCKSEPPLSQQEDRADMHG